MDNDESLSKNRKVTSSRSSHSISSKTLQNNNSREKRYTQRNAHKCFHEEDNDSDSEDEEKEREKDDKASQNTKVSLLKVF